MSIYQDRSPDTGTVNWCLEAKRGFCVGAPRRGADYKYPTVGGKNMKKFVHLVPISIGMLVLLMVLSPALASSNGPTVQILGDNSTRINQRVLSTYHFGPGRLHVRPGAVVTFENTGTCSVPFDCTHTISIVKVSQLPLTVAQVFACLFDQPGTVCATIGDVHFPHGPGGPVVPTANIPGEPSGFQGANSLVIAHGQVIEVTITAPAGTTIHYLCAIHPWMQASITVGNGDSDTSD